MLILIDDIMDAIADPESDHKAEDVKMIIKKTCQNIYHDFKSPLAYPKHQLRDDLLEAGFKDLAKNVLEGRYG